MTLRRTSWQFAADQNWCSGWIAGFAAGIFLATGRRSDYERDRDEYLARKGWKRPGGNGEGTPPQETKP